MEKHEAWVIAEKLRTAIIETHSVYNFQATCSEMHRDSARDKLHPTPSYSLTPQNSNNLFKNSFS